MNDKEIPTLIINLEEYKELVNEFKIIIQRLVNFEFKFHDDITQQNEGLCSEQSNQESS